MGASIELTSFFQLLLPVLLLYEKIEVPVEKIICSSLNTISDELNKSVALAY